jgi:probable HAF family extracellular repeat protein
MWTKGIFAASLFVCLIPAVTVAQIYTVTDLGPLSPTGLNSWAQVVGDYNGHAYIWDRRGGVRPLGTLPGGTFSNAAAINDLGVVTGTADGQGTVVSLDPGWPSQECSDLVQPFTWKQQIQGLGTVGPASDVEFIEPQIACDSPFYAAAINDLAQIVGYTSVLSDDYAWALLWTKSNGMSLFGTSFPPIFATAISNTGEMVGISAGCATYWKNGVTTQLGGLPGSCDGFLSGANSVNDLGQIAGWSETAANCPSGNDCFHAVTWSKNGTITDLGTLPGDAESLATKVNFFGLIIGSSGNTFDAASIFGQKLPEVVGRPFIWSESKGIRDLNTLIRGNSGWVLNSATDINIWGQIVGEGTLKGQPHGFLLTPRNPFRF